MPWLSPPASRSIEVGYWTHRGPRACPRPAVHEHATLLLHTGGTSTMMQRQRLELGAGDVLLIPAGEPHRREASQDAEIWGVSFCAPCHASALALLLEPFERVRSGASAVVPIPGHRQQHLLYLLRELGAETAAGSGHDDRVELSLLSLILAEVGRAAALTVAPVDAPSLVGDALRFIERHCLGPLSPSDVARAVGRSPAHVTTALTRATGKSAGAWIIAGRMAEARRRLLHSDEPIDAIADRVGYADATHFIRMFRREHGATPAAWRAALARSP
jgi:AraC-like DNA-binding protein